MSLSLGSVIIIHSVFLSFSVSLLLAAADWPPHKRTQNNYKGGKFWLRSGDWNLECASLGGETEGQLTSSGRTWTAVMKKKPQSLLNRLGAGAELRLQLVWHWMGLEVGNQKKLMSSRWACIKTPRGGRRSQGLEDGDINRECEPHNQVQGQR